MTDKNSEEDAGIDEGYGEPKEKVQLAEEFERGKQSPLVLRPAPRRDSEAGVQVGG